MPFGKFPFTTPFYGPFGFGKFSVPIGVLAGSYPRAIGPGFAKFPPWGFI